MAGSFIQDRDDSRRYFLSVWEKYKTGTVLEPMEDMVLQVILEHPEYHDYLDQGEAALAQEFTPESGMSNPFLHMGMHIAIREQVSTDRPPGIRNLHKQLARKMNSALEAEHRMLDCLGEVLWRAQREQTIPDEADYMEKIKRLL